MDLSLSVNDYFKQSWDNEKTNAYFNILHSHNYKMNVFSYLSEVMTGGNSLEIAEGKVDNIIEKDVYKRQELRFKRKSFTSLSRKGCRISPMIW